MNSHKFKKIRICGGSGSGKTYLSQLIQKKTRFKLIHLDTIFYDFSNNHKFDKKRSFVEVKKILKKQTPKNKWIIEGGRFSNLKYTYDVADLLIFLKVPGPIRIKNTFKRFFIRFKSGKYEGILNFLDLTGYNLRSMKKWDQERPKLFAKLYGSKFHCFNSADEAYNWFIKQK